MDNVLKLAKIERRLNAAVDWFIPPGLRSSSESLQSARMFLFSHLFGPFLGHTISFSMLFIEGKADLNWWIFVIAVTAFWAFPAALRLTGWYVPLALISIQNLIFCIFWGCYQYGGINSPILPWLITVPLLAFFYLPARTTRILVGCIIIANLSVFYAIYSALGFPDPVVNDQLVALGLVSTFCASVYVSMMALYYANIVSSQVELEQEVQRHRETDRMLRDATQQIERAMLAKSEFLAKMSHELRNPLSSIIGYSEILIEGLSQVDCQNGKDLHAIREAGFKLLELIEDLLNLSRLEAGKMEVALEKFAVADLIDELAEKWRERISDNGNELRIILATDCSDVVCDTGKLRHAVGNLLSNAAKFTKNGMVTLSATVEAEKLYISVLDTGIGIDQSAMKMLFETFGVSEHETASNYGDDVRLGLSLAYRYCKLLGGDLSVESRLGRGSRFTVAIPVGPSPVVNHADCSDTIFA